MEKPEDNVEVVGGEEGKEAEKDDVEDGAEGVGGGEGEAADEDGVEVVAEPPSYTTQAVNYMTPDQAHAAVTRGLLTVPQMQRLLGGPSLTHKKLLRELLMTKAAVEAKAAAEAEAAAEASTSISTRPVAEAATTAPARSRGLVG